MQGNLQFTTVIDSRLFAVAYISELEHYLIYYEIGISYDDNGNKGYVFMALKNDNDAIYYFDSLKDTTDLLIKLGEYREKQKRK